MEVCKMIKTTFMFPIIAVLAVFAATTCEMVVVSPPVYPKSILVSGWDAANYTDKSVLMMLWHPESILGTEIARGAAHETGQDTCLFDLKIPDSFADNWTGSGEYVVMLVILDPDSQEIETLLGYTNETLEITTLGDIPPFLINQQISNIPFDGFTTIESTVWNPGPPMSITITGISEDYHEKAAMIMLHPLENGVVAAPIAYGKVISVNGDSNSFVLKNASGFPTDWTGSGDYVIYLMVGAIDAETAESTFLYTDGTPVADLAGGIPQRHIGEEESTITFAQFVSISPEPEEEEEKEETDS
jgi:hypothetical protein